MIVKYYERTPGGGARLVVDNEFLTIYVDHRFIWGEKALQKEYGLPEVIICKIEDLKCIESEVEDNMDDLILREAALDAIWDGGDGGEE